MHPVEGHDVLETVARRERVLASIANGTGRKRALVDALDVSRSTVDRAIRDLEAASLVERDGSTYGLTVTGRLAVDAYRRCVATFEAITDAREFVELVPGQAPLAAALFEGAAIEGLRVDDDLPEPTIHEGFVDRIVDRIEAAERVTGFSPVEPSPRIRHLLADRTADRDLDAEVLISPELTRYLLSEHPDQLTAMYETDGMTLGEVEGLPYGLVICELPARTCVLVFVHGDTARIRGLVENDTAGALEWARNTYEYYRARATVLG